MLRRKGLLGLAMCVLCLTKDWKLSVGMLIGCGISVIDEGIKVMLPTREFDVTDLMRDFVGVAVAMVLVAMISRLLRKDVTNSGSKT